MGRLLPVVLGAATLLAASAGTPAAPRPLALPSAEDLAEARSIVHSMRKAERGPFLRLRWFCGDGTVHPPQPYPCAERGGGWQHAEHSPKRERLAELGWHVGTIFRALPWEELWDEANRHQRLREIPLERYLVEVDDGWVMHHARYYRGWVQIEDEEEFGYELLLKLLARPDWVRDNYLLAREALRSIPHHGGTDRTRRVRRISKDLAAMDRTFENIRIKIHTSPDAGDAKRVRDWMATEAPAGSAEERLARELVAEMEHIYGAAGRTERFDEARRIAGSDAEGVAIERLLSRVVEAPLDERVARYSEVLRRVRDLVSRSGDAKRNVALLDLSLDVEGELLRAGLALAGERATSRRALAEAARHLADGTYGTGLLSEGERAALASALAPLQGDTVPVARYVEATTRLARAMSWAIGTIRHTFAEPYIRYVALEPKAAQFADDLLHESAIFPFAEVVGLLGRDAEQLAGHVHRVLGQDIRGIQGLNPGASIGRLRIVREAELVNRAPLGRDEIVVLPVTVSDLPPVAGILTVSEGNLLSHVQMLARNLGIPNASISPAVVQALAPHEGREVLLAVSIGGDVVLELPERLAPDLARELAPPGEIEAAVPQGTVDAPAPDLSERRFLPLSALSSSLSGKVVGPKAANVGELARLFPGRVAPAIAIPFGIFAEHVSGGAGSPKARLDRAFSELRAGRASAADLALEVEAVRAAVAGLALSPARRAELEELMGREFGAPGSYGVFVRSDTNVEDLPGFTGAGLNETKPHVVGTERILAAIPEVWASPFRQRAMAWRMRALRRAEEVYPSVLLMKSVPADKSGVLVTTNLATGGDGLTVATGFGVGGVVDGELAETLVLEPGGGTTLLSEAKAPYRRRLEPAGGVSWVPAPTGPVLDERERNALRALAAEVQARLVPERGPDGRPLPWDVEFGFEKGELRLFQVRPLVQRGEGMADRAIRALAPPQPLPGGLVDLSAPATPERATGRAAP